jgi:methylmalonyl-CoA mutase N-terminal domain/subunit
MTVDIIEYCTKNMPRWNFSNFCGIHIREAGSTLVQELAFALGDAITYIEAALDRGLDIDDFAPRISFNFAASVRFLEEAAKFRAARRLWAKLMKEKFGAKKPASLKLRTGTGSPGSTLTAQQPENNIVRVTLHTLASVLGGCQALHTAAMDEALALPTEKSATVALRTQQIVAYESGLAEVIDPLGGSYYIESLTGEIEQQVTELLKKIEEMGGMLRAIESGWVHREIAKASYRKQREVENGKRIVVGVNRFADDEKLAIKLHRPEPQVMENLKKRLAGLRRERNNDQVRLTLNRLKEAARGKDNLMPCVLDAVRAYATVGEVCDTLRGVFGTYEASGFMPEGRSAART